MRITIKLWIFSHQTKCLLMWLFPFSQRTIVCVRPEGIHWKCFGNEMLELTQEDFEIGSDNKKTCSLDLCVSWVRDKLFAIHLIPFLWQQEITVTVQLFQMKYLHVTAQHKLAKHRHFSTAIAPTTKPFEKRLLQSNLLISMLIPSLD